MKAFKADEPNTKYRIIEWLRLERILEIYVVPSRNNQVGLGCLQGGDIHNFAGHLFPVSQHPQSKERISA